jgi:hypothetical protein
VQTGKSGGVPGNFDECLEIVTDASACRCGSGIEEISLDEDAVGGVGWGYVDGPLEAVYEPPACCLHELGCDEGYADLIEPVPDSVAYVNACNNCDSECYQMCSILDSATLANFSSCLSRCPQSQSNQTSSIEQELMSCNMSSPSNVSNASSTASVTASECNASNSFAKSNNSDNSGRPQPLMVLSCGKYCDDPCVRTCAIPNCHCTSECRALCLVLHSTSAANLSACFTRCRYVRPSTSTPSSNVPTASCCNGTTSNVSQINPAAYSMFKPCFEECWISTRKSALNYTTPVSCFQSGKNFKAAIRTRTLENSSSAYCQMNAHASTTVPTPHTHCNLYSGRAESIGLLDPGLGYNLSNTRFALMYPSEEFHLCGFLSICGVNDTDSTCSHSYSTLVNTSMRTRRCEQDNTIRRVFFSGDLRTGNITWDGELYATCEGVTGCTGEGFKGKCHVNYTAVCYSQENCNDDHDNPIAPPIITTSITITNITANTTICNVSNSSNLSACAPTETITVENIFICMYVYIYVCICIGLCIFSNVRILSHLLWVDDEVYYGLRMCFFVL